MHPSDLEDGILARVRRWLDGCPGDGEKGIPGHLVTRERLAALGLSFREAEGALAFVRDPYNHGVDDRMTPRDRRRYADSQRTVAPAPVAEDAAPPAPAPRHWSEAGGSHDAHHTALRDARSGNAIIGASA